MLFKSENFRHYNKGAVCADCSGYTESNVTQIHFYDEEPCRNIYGQRGKECIWDRTASTVVRGKAGGAAG